MGQQVLSIRVSKAGRSLKLTNKQDDKETLLMDANVVDGCEGSGTPSGTFRGGKWIKDKTNPTHGPTPWSKDPWSNPYGPYFLPLNDVKNNRYTTYGIHGTRGPMFGNFEKPPLPQVILSWFMNDDSAKYLYCSHGCIRLSNQNIDQLFRLTTQSQYAGTPITISIE